MKYRKFPIILLFILIATQISGNSIVIGENQNNKTDKKTVIPNIPIPEGNSPLVIVSSNSELASVASSGDGSSLSPYVIDDFYYNGISGDLITIQHTTVYFVISNASFHNLGSTSKAIYLNNVTHGMIVNSTFDNINGYGAYLYKTSNTTIHSNNFNNITYSGIYSTFDKSFNEFRNNTLIDAGGAKSAIEIYIGDGNNTFIDNIIDGGGTYGISLGSKGDNIVVNNTLIRASLTVKADPLASWQQKLVEGNTVNGKPLIYVGGLYNSIFSTEVGQLIIYNSNKITITNQNFENSTVGILLFMTDNVTIQDSYFNNVVNSIYLYTSDDTKIKNTQISNSDIGVFSFYNFGINIENNVFKDNSKAIYLRRSFDTKITNNIFTNNDIGVLNSQIGGSTSMIENNFFEYGSTAISLSSISLSTYYYNISNNIMKSMSGYNLQVTNSRNINFYDNYLDGQGISLSNVNSTIIDRNVIVNGVNALYMVNTHNLNITRNYLHNSTTMINLISSNQTLIQYNEFNKKNSYDLQLDNSRNINFTMNNFIGSVAPLIVNISSNFAVSHNYYAMHTNVDSNDDNYSDSSYSFSGITDSQPLANPSYQYDNSPIVVLEPIDNVFYYNTDIPVVVYAYSLYQSTCDLYINDVFISSYSWTGLNEKQLNLTISTIGISTVEFRLLGDQKYSRNVSIMIELVDQVMLEFISTPDDLEFFEGETGYSLVWIAVDNDPTTYVIYRNNVIIQENNWTNGTYYSISLDGLTGGYYNYTIVFNDGLSNRIIDSVFVNVIDFPDINSPDDISFVQGTTNNQIIWIVSDSNPDQYIIEMNQTLLIQDNWEDAQEITVILDDL
ncbi:MAG: right-handed parallel beta-helix repeat-containing protein, partial [Candidatus Heimdallarchaeota archaeon]|nr:right-handed parallel beta-helix repeat-containing protein [Candidatus Heimdallarchaeota archaeon]